MSIQPKSSVHLKTIINKSMENKELKKVQQRSVDCSSVCYWCNRHVQQVAYQLTNKMESSDMAKENLAVCN
ncbi:hypothetical protein T03_18067 [Trichinella britovi]|uniref:Uncharacterized protein n=1 Tax=Trichinella britovi TaxID=45882 RepID=A0A0V1CFE4_TRIBR|nr:hypothetical protein T03_18067 [Trichinella britovi]